MIHWGARCWGHSCDYGPLPALEVNRALWGREISKGWISVLCQKQSMEANGNTTERYPVKFRVMIQSDQREASILWLWKHCSCLENILWSLWVQDTRVTLQVRFREQWREAPFPPHTQHLLLLTPSLSFLLWLQELLHRHPPCHPAVPGSPYRRSRASDKRLHFNYRLE